MRGRGVVRSFVITRCECEHRGEWSYFFLFQNWNMSLSG